MNPLLYLLEKYPNKPWDWQGISQNPNITMSIIEKYPNKPWDWQWISRNPNITMSIIEKYPNKPWNWCWVSSNPFTYQNKISLTQTIFTQYNKRNNKYAISHKKQTNLISIELLNTPPSSNFLGGIQFHQTMQHFNDLRR